MPMHQRMVAKGGITNRTVVPQLTDPATASATHDWAAHVSAAHEGAILLLLLLLIIILFIINIIID